MLQKTNNKVNSSAIILDDHRFFAEAFAVMLEHNGFVEAAYAFTDPLEIRQYVLQHREGEIYVFLDYYIPDVNVLQLINDVRRLYTKIRVLIVSSISNPTIIQKILGYNPDGFITKTAGIDELADCFNLIRQKKNYISPYFKQIMDEPVEKSLLDSFTPKEMEVLDKLAKGENIEEMAKSLNISRNTVIVHRRNMMAKTGSKSVTSLLALAVKAGIITALEPGN